MSSTAGYTSIPRTTSNPAFQKNDNGDHFDMRDYHVLSMDAIDGNVTDHGVVLDLKDIPWAGRQLWDSDCAQRNRKYYLYFSLKDKNDVLSPGRRHQ
ncbi:MAG: hypothetical protein WDN00_15165 [Limisphaerales bacterium]